MPKHTTHLDQFDIDVAQLGAPLSDAALDALDPIIDARDTASDLYALLKHAQHMIEGGANPYQTREQFAVDLETATDALRRHVNQILGAEQGVY